MRDRRFLLARPEWGYQGIRASLRFLIALTVLTAARSLVHLFAPDGTRVSRDAGRPPK